MRAWIEIIVIRHITKLKAVASLMRLKSPAFCKTGFLQSRIVQAVRGLIEKQLTYILLESIVD